ncbi:hypothetical protein BKG89_01055 [Rodentibacter caecimuris]|uniref:Uncharacterized protein n=1 Tax=Rodentibacter caecimuris TaxID=1796644 RepID=A0ABX3KZN4_9PAST|nr:hypothetical protein BKG89_01055 [Rodentibacter heylii]
MRYDYGNENQPKQGEIFIRQKPSFYLLVNEKRKSSTSSPTLTSPRNMDFLYSEAMNIEGIVKRVQKKEMAKRQ